MSSQAEDYSVKEIASGEMVLQGKNLSTVEEEVVYVNVVRAKGPTTGCSPHVEIKVVCNDGWRIQRCSDIHNHCGGFLSS